MRDFPAETVLFSPAQPQILAMTDFQTSAECLTERHVGVVGMGRAGLQLALAAARHTNYVTWFCFGSVLTERQGRQLELADVRLDWRMPVTVAANRAGFVEMSLGDGESVIMDLRFCDRFPDKR